MLGESGLDSIVLDEAAGAQLSNELELLHVKQKVPHEASLEPLEIGKRGFRSFKQKRVQGSIRILNINSYKLRLVVLKLEQHNPLLMIAAGNVGKFLQHGAHLSEICDLIRGLVNVIAVLI